MTRIFDRPSAAMFAYEQSLKRPISWPPTRHDVPTLWERAKAMFGVVTKAITSVANLAQRFRFGRTARRHLLGRLLPVEHLVRTLLMTEAAAYLLMTPEGRRLRAETPLVTPPDPPPPVGVARPKHSTTILMPGWQTIAALHPRIDPRVVEREERERREALERRIAGLETLVAEDGAPDPDDPGAPETWRCHFRVLRWVHPEPDDEDTRPPMPEKRRGGPSIMTFSDSNFPLAHGMTVVQPPEQKRASDLDATHGGLALARRIEALSRVLANPAPAILRLARRIAAIPAECLTAPEMRALHPRGWWHGNPENWNACNLAEPAFRALERVALWRATPVPEPG